MNKLKSELLSKHCQPCRPGTKALDDEQVEEFLSQIQGWKVEGGKILKNYQFQNYYETIAFVNSIAWVAHREDHHPDLEVSYNKCVVRYNTHSVGGLSENDFICAAKVDALMGI
jgi:4a-hydroxytetrahydrobiopterin dehydratase